MTKVRELLKAYGCHGQILDNKRCANFVNEAMECLARIYRRVDITTLYREAPLNGIGKARVMSSV